MRATTLVRSFAAAAALSLGLTAAAAGAQFPGPATQDDASAVAASGGRTVERDSGRGTRDKGKGDKKDPDRTAGANVQSQRRAPEAEDAVEQEEEVEAEDTAETEDEAETADTAEAVDAE